MRPDNISPEDWERMPWYAREKAQRRHSVRTVKARSSMPHATTKQTGKPKRRIRVYRVEPGYWEVTDGVSTARTATAQAAWSLLARLEVAS
jgi:hypothetical protein